MSTESDHPRTTSFANHVLPDWEAAMDDFYTAVERKMRARDLTTSEVMAALTRGYGDEIADGWVDWMDEEA